ncbi:unnamed protein product [Ceutorhynchus assimilis]|uniref:Zinc finger MYM-type protein 1 n=1 Tax=Ceutorhynchus assimilis TaxID=467358 RepID=A0A9N9QAM0_9CUCU|nr:unnamed protein product [Ceutorhynchus assimilis]
MQLPIKAVLYLGKQVLPFNTENFNELLETLVSTSTIDIREHYKTIRHLFTSETGFQMEILDCLSKYLEEVIQKELKKSNFFSFQIDDVSINKQSQCSIIVRYVLPDDGLVRERFLGFHQTNPDKNPNDLSEMIMDYVARYMFPSKLIAQSYDGSCIKSEHLKLLEETIKSKSDASFVHSSAHKLNFLLEQSCNGNSKFSAFFANVSSLLSFFHQCAKYSCVAETSAGKGMEEATSTLDVLTLVNNCWDDLKDLFTHIIEKTDSDPLLIKKSRYFLKVFTDEFEFALLAAIFGDIFDLTETFCQELQKVSYTKIDNCISEFSKVQKLLMEKRNKSAFQELYFPTLIRATPLHPEHEDIYKNMYYEILDTILVQLNTRFENINKIRMFTLFHISKLGKLPKDSLCCIKETYPNIFTESRIQRLKTELQLIYADEKYQVTNPQELLTVLNNDSDVLKESYKLFCLLLAIPFTRVGTTSCLDKVKNYLSKASTEERLPAMANISIEKDLVNELINTQPFYEDVIDRFAELTSPKIDLILKK